MGVSSVSLDPLSVLPPKMRGPTSRGIAFGESPQSSRYRLSLHDAVEVRIVLAQPRLECLPLSLRPYSCIKSRRQSFQRMVLAPKNRCVRRVWLTHREEDPLGGNRRNHRAGYLAAVVRLTLLGSQDQLRLPANPLSWRKVGDAPINPAPLRMWAGNRIWRSMAHDLGSGRGNIHNLGPDRLWTCRVGFGRH